MKKVINGKSYNTEYDSEKIARYDVRMDGWAHTAYTIFRKKSTGEYFEFSKWSEWNDGWDINLISEKKAMDILAHNRKGEDYRFEAVMAPFPGERKKGLYFWGTRDDDPWFGKKAEERKEEMKRKREETIRKAEEAAKAKEESGEKTWGVARITRTENGFGFGRIYGKDVPVEKKGKVKCHKINIRIENNDKGNGYNCAYTYKVYVVLDENNKEKAKDIVMETISGVIKEKGEFEPVMKGGHIIETEPEKNKEMWREIHSRIRKQNEAVIWG